MWCPPRLHTGPLLFLLLVNDLPSAAKSCQIIPYADNAVLYNSHQTPELLEQELNEDTNRVANCFKGSRLSLNLKRGKTELVKYGAAPKVKSTSCKIEIKGITVNESKEYEYLEIYLESQLNFYC